MPSAPHQDPPSASTPSSGSAPSSGSGPSVLDRALAIAREAHQGQKRRHGAPYLGHPVAVRQLVEDVAFAVGHETHDDTRVVALLHDVLEDSEIDAAELAARFGEGVAHKIDLLTKRGKGPEATAAYYARMRAHADDTVRLVKVCDRVHNLSELHLDPNVDKLHKYVGETFEHIVPVAREAADRAVALGLVEALHDAIRAACRAQRQPIPDGARLTASRVPVGIYAILSGSGVDAVEAQLGALLDGGVAIVQLRAKGCTDREVLAMVEALHPRCREAGVPLVVNDRPDLCAASGADGVHVGQTDLPPRLARRIVGADKLLGASSHTEPELVDVAKDADADGGAADHVAVGPVYLSPTKQGHAPVVGLEALARRCRISRLPVVAIGGVTSPQRVAECAGAGASLVAAVSALEGPGAREMCRRMSVSFFAARARARMEGSSS